MDPIGSWSQETPQVGILFGHFATTGDGLHVRHLASFCSEHHSTEGQQWARSILPTSIDHIPLRRGDFHSWLQLQGIQRYQTKIRHLIVLYHTWICMVGSVSIPPKKDTKRTKPANIENTIQKEWCCPWFQQLSEHVFMAIFHVEMAIWDRLGSITEHGPSLPILGVYPIHPCSIDKPI